MTGPTDLIILAIGFGSFIFFLFLHFGLFRFLKAEQLFKGITATFAAGFLVCLAASMTAGHEDNLVSRPVAVSLSLFIYTMASFVYILCFFGPYETSIRMRLVRELFAAPQGMSLPQLLGRYNAAVILDTRLKRLLGAGDLLRRNQGFCVCPKFNAFFAIDAVARKMHAFIHSR